MSKIPFMDLSRQYHTYKNEFLSAIEEVCNETSFSGGRFVEKFENEFANYLGVQFCACVNSGTSAIHLAMLALGIRETDEVIVPANTFIASAWGAAYIGAKPVFVDCRDDTWEIDTEKIEEKITSRTKAVVGVHLYGQPFDFDGVNAVAKKHGLYVIEDCAQAHGAEYKGKKCGTLGDVGCFSFYPGKNLGGFGEGGAVTTSQETIDRTVRILRSHGAEKKYCHEMLGYNMRMDGIQGAVLSVKLKYLEEWNRRRWEIAERYLKEIQNPRIRLQEHPDNTKSVFHLFEVEVDGRDDFLEYCETNGICCGQHYPIPCHLQQAFSYLDYRRGDCPNAEQLADKCISLPMFPELTDDEVSRVIDICNDF
ncbi:MAG: DegT/DnrJ/EryC1/StrS family aminotransferase [Blautia sp.]|nr:DegT/DnrJ/EryC1/StrS family aminotransferase [Blautia sp.]